MARCCCRFCCFRVQAINVEEAALSALSAFAVGRFVATGGAATGSFAQQLETFGIHHGLTRRQVRRLEDLAEALQSDNHDECAEEILRCNKEFYGEGFKTNAHRNALLGLLFKTQNSVQPAQDERHQGLLEKLRTFIREGVMVKELFALDAALRLRFNVASTSKQEEAIASCVSAALRMNMCNHPNRHAVVDLLLEARNVVQPARNEQRQLVLSKLRQFVHTCDGHCIERLLALDAALRLRNSNASLAEQQNAISLCVAMVHGRVGEHQERYALFDFLFEARNVVQPVFDKERERTLEKIDAFIRHGVFPNELLALDFALRLRGSDSSVVVQKAVSACFTAIINADRSDSRCLNRGALINLLLEIRGVVQPTRDEQRRLVLAGLNPFIREGVFLKQLLDVDAALRHGDASAAATRAIASCSNEVKKHRDALLDVLTKASSVVRSAEDAEVEKAKRAP